MATPAANREDARPEDAGRDITWDLSDLYDSNVDANIEKDLQQTENSAKKLANGFRGRIAGLNADELRKFLENYERLLDAAGRISTFAYLSWSTNTEDPARGALLQKTNEFLSRLHQQLLFIELEWAQAPEETVQALMGQVVLSHYRHWLMLCRRYRPHLLSEPEEKILAEKAVTGRNAWVRFFEEVHSAARYELDGQMLPAQTVLNKLYDPERSVRQRAAEAITRGLKTMSRTCTYIFNNILADKSSNDRLRSYSSWISARNLDNQIDDGTVEALIEAVTSRYDIVSRYYRLKKKLLDLPELTDYDRYAPLPAADRRFTWQEAQEQVLSAYSSFHPLAGNTAAAFFKKRWIDAAVVPGKKGGAYMHPAVPSVHPYVFMNYEGTARDVMTLAHELGHGLHQALASEQGILLSDTPLTTAETASTFGEMLVFQDLMAKEKEAKVRLAMLVQKIEETFGTVFRQVAMNRFEESMHQARRTEGELTTERFGELWMETQKVMFQGSVTLTDNYSSWWSYIPHFINSPGYVYAYSFGELLVLALYARYQEIGEAFPNLYLDLLKAGGSDWPETLLKPLGVDLGDPGFWAKGLDMIDELVGQAEAMV